MFKAIFLASFSISCLISLHTDAQGVCTVKGKVVNAANNPVDGAIVLLKSLPDSTLTRAVISNQSGSFEFRGVPYSEKASYFLSVSSIGYTQVFTEKLVFNHDGLADAIQVVLTPHSKSLREVLLTENRPMFQTSAGKVTVNVNNTILSAGASAMEVLSKAPGILIDNNETIRLNGRSGVQVMIDGKNSRLQQEELANLLNSTPANTIDQIELISNATASYDAAGAGGIIHIKLKKDQNHGTNGSLTFISGISDLGYRYKANYRANPGFSFNTRNKQSNIFGTYSYGDQAIGRSATMNRRINYNNQITLIDVDYFSRQQRQNHTYRGGIDYFLTPSSVFGILLNGISSNIGIKKLNNSLIANGNLLHINSEAGQTRSIRSNGINLNFKNTSSSGNEFSADLDYSRYNRDSEEMLTNAFISSQPVMGPAILENYSPGNYTLKSAKADYSISLGEKSKLSSGLKASRVESDNSLDFGEVINAAFVPYHKFTSRFRFDENILSGYLDFSSEFKSGNLQIGLRAEKTSSKAVQLISGHVTNRDYLNLFPNLQYSKDLGKDKLTFSYSRRIERPLYEDLNPFLGYLDQYSYRSGNPYLRPSTSHTVELTHSYRGLFSATLSTSLTDKFSTNIFEQNDSSSIVTQIKRNLDKQYVYGVILNTPFKLMGNRLDVNFNVQALYVKFRSGANTSLLNQGGMDVTFTLINSVNMGQGFTAELLAKYETPSWYGISRYQSIYFMDAGFSKTILNKRGSVRLRMSDLFNSTNVRSRSDFQNLDLHYKEKPESRVAVLSFSWNMGKSTVSASRKRSTSGEAEQKRLGQ